MPPALISHTSVPGSSPHGVRETEVVGDSLLLSRRQKEAPICPTDDEAAIPQRKSAKDKRSLDYIWRSGVAGGLAGCAVCGPTSDVDSRMRPYLLFLYVLTLFSSREIGQNSCCAARQSQDSLSIAQSSLCQIYGLLVWRG